MINFRISFAVSLLAVFLLGSLVPNYVIAGPFKMICREALSEAPARLDWLSSFADKLKDSRFEDEGLGDTLRISGITLKNNRLSFHLENQANEKFFGFNFRYDDYENQLEIIKIELPYKLRARGIGTAILRLLYQTAPPRAKLVIISDDFNTNTWLRNVAAQLREEPGYIRRNQTSEYEAEQFLAEQLKMQAVALSGTAHDGVWIKALNSAGWRLKQFNLLGLYPLIEATK